MVSEEIAISPIAVRRGGGEDLTGCDDAQHERADEPANHGASPIERYVLARLLGADAEDASLHQIVHDQRALYMVTQSTVSGSIQCTR